MRLAARNRFTLCLWCPARFWNIQTTTCRVCIARELYNRRQGQHPKFRLCGLQGSQMSAAPGSALRVVAIDDDEQHLKFIANVLSRENVKVHTATNPQARLEQVYKQRPNLVVVDLVMPGMSGLETLQRVVEFDPSIEVVLLTGQYSTESAVEAIQKGAADYLTKPVDVEKLDKRVESLLTELHKGQRCVQLEHEL